MFGRLPEETLSRLTAALKRRTYDEGQILFHKGDPGDEMYIVEEGAVAIFEPGDAEPDKERPLRIFRAGGSLGEMALIDREPRTLSARAVQPTHVLVLKGKDFENLVRDPAMAMAVMSGLSDRIRYTTDFLAEVRQWVGRMAGGQYETAQFFTDMQTWVRQVAAGEYEADVEETAGQYRDPTMATLAAEFARMATHVREREAELRQEIAQLKIEIDHTKRQEQVEEIVESDFFQDIKSKARDLRRRRE
ncbi:MAG: cyclic nucleotide-binding domain-containing protein [Anaerolineae bacterium]